MVHPAVMAAKVSSGGAFATTTHITADSTGSALWTEIKGISVGSADYANASKQE